MSNKTSSELINYSLLIFLGAVWAASFVAIKFSNEIFNPIEVGFYRTFIGSLFLFCAVKLRKGSINIISKNTKTNHLALERIYFFQNQDRFFLSRSEKKWLDKVISGYYCGLLVHIIVYLIINLRLQVVLVNIFILNIA